MNELLGIPTDALATALAVALAVAAPLASRSSQSPGYVKE
jgi:hypothetical protein